MPLGANTNTNKPNGIEPNQEFENILTKLKVSNPFSKEPNTSKT